jgi:hypothetical protein
VLPKRVGLDDENNAEREVGGGEEDHHHPVVHSVDGIVVLDNGKLHTWFLFDKLDIFLKYFSPQEGQARPRSRRAG